MLGLPQLMEGGRVSFRGEDRGGGREVGGGVVAVLSAVAGWGFAGICVGANRRVED